MEFKSFDLPLEEDALQYGTPRHSGRYPWGSGENPYQHEEYFRKARDEYLKQGFTEKDIIQAMGMSSTKYRQMATISKDKVRAEKIAQATKLKEKGYSNVAIGEIMGINESSVRILLRPGEIDKTNKTREVANFLKQQLETKKYLDVGTATEREISDILGYKVSTEKLNTALKMLEDEGYGVIGDLQVEQVTNRGKYTTVKVLGPGDMTKKDIYNDLTNLKSIGDYETESEASVLGINRPKSVSLDDIYIRYGEENGAAKEGVIELRRGVDNLSLGGANYAQVRIAVDDKYYLKGMAVYSDDVPEGYDIIFNTQKSSSLPINKVLKPLKTVGDSDEINWDNPFGATIKRQGKYVDEDGVEQQNAINIVNEEGSYGEWAKTLSSQFLSKQSIPMIKKQLNLSYLEKEDEYETIMSLENAAVKKKLLESFSEDCDAAAVHLKAASLPRQAFQVILPLTTLKDNEIYAPNYQEGEEVVLVRYPHGGTFEIPRLKVVSHDFEEGVATIGKQAKDAVGINANAAKKLSGADFDGDTVLVIPVNDKVRVQTSTLKDLESFDHLTQYAYKDGIKLLTPQQKQMEMGKVSNLITDMTLKGANKEELTRAVKHSMVIIDAEKHKLDWQQSEQDNNIKELKDRYQNGGGASTLLSKASSTEWVDERKIFSIDRNTNPETGEKEYVKTGRTYKNKAGKIVGAQQESSKMAETNDATTLISNFHTQQEIAYADYANKLKSLANTARKSYLQTENTPYSPTAKQTYQEEVDSLKSKLNNALKNAPKERLAQITATTVVKAQKDSNPEISKSDEKRLRQQALSAARARVGASKKDVQVNITDREWEAIQAGAVSNSLLRDVLNNTDMDSVKQRAMPRSTTLSDAKVSRIKALQTAGYSTAQIAEAVGVSTTTVTKYM